MKLLPAFLVLALAAASVAYGQTPPAFPLPNIPTTALPRFEAPVKVNPLDADTIATGGTAITAIAAGHATRGGVLASAIASGFCYALVGEAGTATSGNTVCEASGTSVSLPPTAGAVSVNATEAGSIGGYGCH